VPGFRNILLIQLGDIGDVVLTTPALRAVRESYPEARVSILVRKPFGSLLAADPYLHEVIEAAGTRGVLFHTLREHWRFARRLRHARYNLVVDLRTSNRGALLAFLTGAQERIGRQAGKSLLRNLAFTRLLPNPPYAPLPVHPGADQALRIVRAIGIDTGDSIPRLHVSPEDAGRAAALLSELGLASGRRWVSINPCSRWKYKEWSHSRWGELIDRLWQDYQLPSVLIGSPDEAGTIDQITGERSDHAFNLAGKTTLGELSAVLAASSLHLGVDSAAPHIAAAVGTPTMTIFGPTNWKSWIVTDELHRVVTADMPCVPCNRKGCDDSQKSQCLDDLSVDMVYAEAQPILKTIL
jgi:lipopolysaccharide heptosyltransferase III